MLYSADAKMDSRESERYLLLVSLYLQRSDDSDSLCRLIHEARCNLKSAHSGVLIRLCLRISALRSILPSNCQHWLMEIRRPIFDFFGHVLNDADKSQPHRGSHAVSCAGSI
jgi:hypothetical protein